MKISLDTNRYTDFQRSDRAVRLFLEATREIFIPFAVAGELRAGFAAGSRRLENEAVFALFLARPGVSILYPDEQTTHVYGELVRRLKMQGTPIPTNDIWIGAITFQHDLSLYTRAAHFDHLPMIRRA